MNKKIRLITLFSGYDSQKKALDYLDIKCEHYKTCEWAVKSIQAIKDLHFEKENIDWSSKWNNKYIFGWLYRTGISMDYNKPMTLEQIKRLGEQKCRNIFNNIINTHNLVNIQQVSGDDLQIVDTDKYDYIVTYSYPCQDLSLAGKGEGMSKGSGTRSGMLWEFERILSELNRGGQTLPKYLLMENVSQVHGTKNIKDFQEWINFLSSLGYNNFYKDLNSKNFCIPQNRKRCFMLSILGNENFEFPEDMNLELRLKDLLDAEVSETYYLSNKTINKIKQSNLAQERKRIQENDCCDTLLARDWKDPKCIQVAQLEGQFESSNRVYSSDGLSPTLNTCNGGNREVKILKEELIPFGTYYTWKDNQGNINTQCNRACDENGCSLTIPTINGLTKVLESEPTELQQKVCDSALKHKLVEPTDVIDYTYSNSRLKEIENGFIKTKNGENNEIMNTLTTRCENFGVCVNTNNKRQQELSTKIDTRIDGQFLDFFNQTTNENISGTITTGADASNCTGVYNNYRIRKLTERECFRLMGIIDEDFDKISKNQSKSSLYHLAGDSIVTTCLMAIFGKLFNINYKEKINQLINKLLNHKKENI